MRAEEILTKYFCDQYKIVPDMECEVEYVDPYELLVPYRLDLVAKIIWLKANDFNVNKTLADLIYSKHIEAITNGTCVEGGKEEKNSVEKYKEVFTHLVPSLKNGFDPQVSAVPVGKDNAIMDGAHRTATCLYYGIKVPIVRLPQLEARNNAQFFIDRLMEPDLVEILVAEYCKLKNNTYALCIWPKGDDAAIRAQTEELIKKTCSIIYKKEMALTEAGLRNLMIQIYREHEWMGSATRQFSGATNKSNACWKGDSTVLFYFVDGPELDQMLTLKKHIRELFNIGNHSVHITDNSKETVQIANLVLNSNSLNLIKEGTPDKYIKLNVLIEKFKLGILEQGKNLDDYLVDSSAVLGLYGIREVNDLDYVTFKGNVIHFEDEDIDDHTPYIGYHDMPIDGLLYNPQNYLYYNEVKFISLKRARAFKCNRREQKDLEDVKLIDSFIKHEFILSNYIYKIKLHLKKIIRKAYNQVHGYIKKYETLHKVLKQIKVLVRRYR